jgi:6-phosphofructokinase 1
MEIAAQVQKALPEIEAKVTIIGHLQRGGAPSCADRVLASRLGFSAVESLINGNVGNAIGVINDEITYTPFKDAIQTPKVLKPALLKMAKVLSL